MTRVAHTLGIAFPEPRFRALDGHVELAVAEAAQGSGPRPHRVTSVLAAMCDAVGEHAVDADLLRSLCTAGRDWLLLRAGMQFYSGPDWFEGTCRACSARFDIECDLRQVPVSEAGDGFPEAQAETSLGMRRFEVPNGGHEEVLAAKPAKDARRTLVGLCGLDEKAVADSVAFTPADLEAIDRALEAISPQIATHVDTNCPECGEATRLSIDPLTFAFPAPARILRDVVTLARAFGWSEEEILELPSSRRKSYVQLAGDSAGRAARRRAAA